MLLSELSASYHRGSMRRPYYEGPSSDHFDGKQFFGSVKSGRKPFREILRWRIFGKRAAWPAEIPNPAPDPVFAAAAPKSLRVTFIGHATCLIQIEGLNLLVDPVWSDRASPTRFAGPRRSRKPGLALSDLPAIDLVLVTHNHYDHLDPTTLAKLVAAHDPMIVTPLGNDTIIRRVAPKARIIAIDWDETATCGPLSVTAAPVQHWSARGVRDRNAALWSGFILRWGEHAVFLAGDTGYGEGWWAKRARLADRRYDLAVLPIGAYEPRWFMEDAHMMPEEAIAAFEHLHARRALGVHFGTFNLTDEPMAEPQARLQVELLRREIEPEAFRTLEPGKAWTIYL
jgi:L-ascorbate metabolism protein UlaG (beta-lactamase superfamily)